MIRRARKEEKKPLLERKDQERRKQGCFLSGFFVPPGDKPNNTAIEMPAMAAAGISIAVRCLVGVIVGLCVCKNCCDSMAGLTTGNNFNNW